MPENKNAIVRHRIIDKLLRRDKYVKTSEIVDAYLQFSGKTVTEKTIQNDIRDMRDDPDLGYFASSRLLSYKESSLLH